jgi:hypothetical protein
MSAGHAKLSPSGAHRWMACPGSIVLESNIPDKGSVYADEGTAAHELAAWCLKDNMDPSNYLNEKISVGENRFTIDAAMCDHVRSYIKLVREYAQGAHLMVEQAVGIGHLTGEDDATGTSDAIIIDAVKRSLTVVDLKYGMGVRVDATENPQLMLYALGAYEATSMLADFDTVTMVIHMPRLNHVSEWTIPIADLIEFGSLVSYYATETRLAEADEAAALGAQKPTDSGWAEKYLNPGEKQCRFCKAKGVCPALRDSLMETVTGSAPATVEDFANVLPIEVDVDAGDNYLTIAMDKVDLVEMWCKAIRAEVERRLLDGERVTGYKLVQGRRGNRKWADEEDAVKALKAARLKDADMYKKMLISPTEAEKHLKGSPARWAKVLAHVTQSEGKPSVAKATDKRPEVAVNATAEDFRSIL